MTLDGLKALREPFAVEHVGKLPRVTCKDCSDKRVECKKHQRAKCGTCDAFISTAHIHLDFVGHAEVTDRLLTVDPAWSWEPVAFDDRGLPAVVPSAGGRELILWGRLTVLGVTRLGCGSVASDSFDAEKQLIGDFIRNAAMRFGVALDLWSKTELESADGDEEPGTAPRSRAKAAPKAASAAPQPAPSHPGSAEPKRNPWAEAIHIEATRLKVDADVLDGILLDITGGTSANGVTRGNKEQVLAALRDEAST